MNDFEGMSREEFQMLALEVRLIHLQARAGVLEGLIQKLFAQSNQKDICGMPIADYILQTTKQIVPQMIGLVADYDPERATKLSKMLEFLEKGHV